MAESLRQSQNLRRQLQNFPTICSSSKASARSTLRKLNAHGITTFAQIAAWKKADIIAVEKYLEFDGRIAREDWIGQAKQFAKGIGLPKPKAAKAGGRK